MIHSYTKKLSVLGLALFGGMLATSNAHAQTACSELFFSEYIEGSSGNNKVLEIYNPTNAPVNLADYSVKLYANGAVAANNTLVLSGTLASGDVVVIAHPQASAAILALADIVAPTTSGANPTNFNGDDAVGLYKTVGTVETLIDLIGNIGCDPGSEWVSGTVSTVNKGIRRLASVNTGVTADPADTPCDFPTLGTQWADFVDTDLSNLGSHTATGCATPPAGATVGFAVASATVLENAGAVTVTVNLTNPSTTAATTVDVALATTGTATAGTDFTFTGSTLTWAAGDNTPKTVTINVTDDAAIETAETVVLNLTNISTGANLGTSTYTLTIDDNDAVVVIPTVTVASITVNDPINFLPTQAGQQVKLVGTLYGENQRSTGLQLTLIDATGGVGLFTTNGAVVPTVAPVEGDLVRAIGTVAHFNGLTQLNLDSIVVISNNQTLVTPTVVNGPLTEAHESELITLANPVSLVTPSQWPTTSAGTDVDVTDGVNTYRLRAVPSANLHTIPAPTGQFVLTGIGGQFDSSDPRDSGYQIIPRRLSDLRDVTGVSESLSAVISVYPNPVSDVLKLNLTAVSDKNASIAIVNALGQVVKTVPASATQVNVANLPAGVYTLKVTAAKGTAVKRFVKVN